MEACDAAPCAGDKCEGSQEHPTGWMLEDDPALLGIKLLWPLCRLLKASVTFWTAPETSGSCLCIQVLGQGDCGSTSFVLPRLQDILSAS